MSIMSSADMPSPSSSYNVLVTGSAGHLGTALMLYLPTVGYHPLGIDILASETTTLVGNISDRSFINDIVAQHPALRHIVHAATLHKPHISSHSPQDFIDTNITGTLVLLEAAAASLPDLESFVFVSTTSTFGAALSPAPGQPAAWIDESVSPLPKNIYGVTKCAAEDLCFLATKQQHQLKQKRPLPVLVLRTSRFFAEEDDEEDRRAAMCDDNLKVMELTYRRCDIADIATACRCAMEKASTLRWGKFIISAPPPFPHDAETLALLDADPAQVMRRVCPAAEEVFAAKGWKFLTRIDRVYDSSKAVELLGWKPEYTFARSLEAIGRGEDFKSYLASKVGRRGYHAKSHGVYTKR